jgi:hypothetical protein
MKKSGGAAAGLPRYISNDFNARWRRKAAATAFFISLLAFFRAVNGHGAGSVGLRRGGKHQAPEAGRTGCSALSLLYSISSLLTT